MIYASSSTSRGRPRLRPSNLLIGECPPDEGNCHLIDVYERPSPEFMQEPVDRCASVDAGFRDPWGNGWKIIGVGRSWIGSRGPCRSVPTYGVADLRQS